MYAHSEDDLRNGTPVKDGNDESLEAESSVGPTDDCNQTMSQGDVEQEEMLTDAERVRPVMFQLLHSQLES